MQRKILVRWGGIVQKCGGINFWRPHIARLTHHPVVHMSAVFRLVVQTGVGLIVGFINICCKFLSFPVRSRTLKQAETNLQFVGRIFVAQHAVENGGLPFHYHQCGMECPNNGMETNRVKWGSIQQNSFSPLGSCPS